MKKWIAVFLSFLFVCTACLSFAEEATDADAMVDRGNEALEAGDYATALELYTRAADLGNARAVNNLGCLYEVGAGVEQSYEMAAACYRIASEMGQGASTYNLATLYYYGFGVEQDYSRAFELFNLAADQGVPDALGQLGYMCLLGEGTEADYAKALEYCTRGEELWNSVSIYNLGLIFQNGLGVEQNHDKAFEYYSRAADMGYAPAFLGMAVMYLDGLGREPDVEKGMEYLIRAAEMGYPLACEAIGEMYRDGENVEQDYEKAADWFRLAAELGGDEEGLEARENYDRLAAEGKIPADYVPKDPIQADKDRIPDGRWLCTNIAGNVTESTPAELKDNYDLYVNKEWYLEAKIPEGKSSAGATSEVSDLVDGQLLALLKDETLTGHDAALVQKLYQMITDWDYRNAQGVEPAMPAVDALRAVSSLESLYACMFDPETPVVILPVDVSVGADLQDSSVNITAVSPIDLLLNKDAAEYTARTRAGDLDYSRYQQISRYVLQRLGLSEEEAAAAFENAISCEALFAAHMKPTAAHYEPDYRRSLMNYYNEQELADLAGAFPIVDLLKASGLYGGKRFLVAEPDYISALAGVFTEENVPLIRDWLLVKLANKVSKLLDQEMYEKTTDITNAVNGVSGRISDDRNALESVKSWLPVPLDNLYIGAYCTAQQKQEITEIINEVLAYYHDMLRATDWLGEDTRAKAIEKLDAIRIQAVYPDKTGDWSELDFAGKDENGSLLAVKKAAAGFKAALNAAKIDQPVDKDEWNQVSRPAYTVNASYSPTVNTIMIFAGILNGDIYRSDMSYEQKLAGIGTIIGHEISHAFDTNGAQHDKDGSMNNWWTQADLEAFQSRAAKLASWFSGFIPYEGCEYSGRKVQTEAIADMAGMKCVLGIAAQKEGFDYDAFFRQYGILWRRLMPLNALIKKAASDVHPLAYMRINATLAQFDDFIRFYGIQPGDGMYIAPEDRVAVW